MGYYITAGGVLSIGFFKKNQKFFVLAIPAHYARDCRVSCARARRYARRTCGRVLCACISRARGRGVGWFVRFLVGFAGGLVWVSVAVFGGVCGWVFGGGFGGCLVWWGVWVVYSLALTRSRLADSRKTAHGSRLAGVRLLAVGVRVGGWCPSANLIFLSLIISPP